MKLSWQTSHGVGNSGIFVSPLQSRLGFPNLLHPPVSSPLRACSLTLAQPHFACLSSSLKRWGKNPWPLHSCIFHAIKTSNPCMKMLSMAARVGWTLTLQNHVVVVVVVWGTENFLGLCLSQVENLAGWSLFLRAHVHYFSI